MRARIMCLSEHPAGVLRPEDVQGAAAADAVALSLFHFGVAGDGL